MRFCCALLLSLLAGLAFHAPDALAKDEPKADADPYILFRVAGRKWMLKRTPKPGAIGNNTVNYQQFEVQQCFPEKAEITQLPFDEAKQADPSAMNTMNVEFKPENFMFKDPVGFKKGKVESLKTDVGTFECTVWTAEGGEAEGRQWRSNDFPGLVVKQDDQYSTRMLIEFEWVEGDPGYKSAKKKKPDPDKIEETRLFKTKGAKWILRTDITRGERGTKSVEVTQTEVKKTGESECELEITKLSQLLQRIKGEDAVTLTIKFDDSLKQHLAPSDKARLDRTEKRITKIGLFECAVYTYKDEEGRAATAWYASNWPGLLLKREVEGENYKAVTEILSFEE